MEQQRYFQPAQTGVIWVQGEAGAKSYPVTPGNSFALFDSESEKFYIKSVDISGMPQPLRTFKYEEIRPVAQTIENIQNAVTKDDLDEFETSVLNKVDEMMQKYLSNKKHYDKESK